MAMDRNSDELEERLVAEMWAGGLGRRHEEKNLICLGLDVMEDLGCSGNRHKANCD